MPLPLFDDPNIAPPPPGGLLLAPGQDVPGVGMGKPDAGIGVSAPAQADIGPVAAPAAAAAPASAPAPAPAANDTVQSRFANMSPAGKFFAGLSEFGAGMQGKPSPLQAKVNQERLSRQQDTEELKANLGVMRDAVNVAQNLSPEARDKMISEVGAKMDKAGLGDTFRAYANDPSLLDKIKAAMPNLSPALQLLARTNPAEFAKSVGTGAVQKQIDEGNTKALLTSATQKAQITKATILQHPDALAAAGVPQPLIAAFNKSPSASTFAAINDALPQTSPSRMTPQEMYAANHDDHFHQALGMLSPKGEEAIKVKQGEVTDTPFMKEAAALYGKGTAAYNAAVQKHVDRVDSPTKVMVGPAAQTPADIARKNAPQAEALYKDYANHPQVKEAAELETKLKPLADYMVQFAKTGKSINANDAALSKAYLAATTSLGNRAYTLDTKALSALPDLGDRIGNMASSFFSGHDLTDQTRHDMFQVIRGRYQALDAARTAQKNSVISRAQARGIPKEQIFGTE